MKTDLNSLRQTAHKILRLPKPAQQVVYDYLHLRIGGTETACPYHINPGLRSQNRALLGKGSPQEIEAFATKYFQNQAMHVAEDPARLRAFLSACGLGVDCSGFATWVLNGVTQATLGQPIWKYLTFPGIKRSLISKVRPVENTSARLLTSELNAEPIPDLAKLKPGDLIRAAAAHHVLVIIEVGQDKAGNAHYFQYAQSSCMYGNDSGVRTGHAIIQRPQSPLLDQQWFDNYPTSVVEELIAEGGAGSKVVRLKALKSILD